ncbi:MAG: glutamate synthase subunit alpha, partial [Acidobacteria bacterium]|nr:glutamate synthase subunit alpha [Acidobacteriota bacterium]
MSGLSPFERFNTAPKVSGLYDPARDKDACGLAMVATLRGTPGHDIIRTALQALTNLDHRGAVGSDEGTGDGAGLLSQIPDRFFRSKVSFELPALGHYGAGLVYLEQDADERAWLAGFEQIAAARACKVLGVRTVPTRPEVLGDLSRKAMPKIIQVFISSATGKVGIEFERDLYYIRKLSERKLGCYHSSLSSKTIVYKGMLTTMQLEPFYPDLSDELFESKLAIVHSRFSTNTFPSWPLAHPFRFIAHNGEINTVKGNRNWMRAREAKLQSELLPFLDELKPINTAGASDSASFDEVLELLVLSGRSLPHALMMMIPEAWEKQADMPTQLQEFYEYHSMLMEPWDGPA